MDCIYWAVLSAERQSRNLCCAAMQSIVAMAYVHLSPVPLQLKEKRLGGFKNESQPCVFNTPPPTTTTTASVNEALGREDSGNAFSYLQQTDLLSLGKVTEMELKDCFGNNKR